MAVRLSVGATYVGEGTLFRVWAPEAARVEVVIERRRGATPEIHSLEKADCGVHSATVSGIGPGALYAYCVDGHGPYPDPASRYQPDGVHGRSQVIDPAAFTWTDLDWKGLELEDTVLYELHIGTFTPGGTFYSAAAKLPLLKDLGVTAIELMPVADFAGSRNWGYDGVAPFAPARCYGSPDDFRSFVNDAHSLGLAVHLDVVYNHFGPDGGYHAAFSPYYFSASPGNPWGTSLNFSGPFSGPVRDYFIDNALHWVNEYHLDGLRLDSTHTIVDDSSRHFLGCIGSAIRESVAPGGRRVLVIAEDSRNLNRLVQTESEGGWGLDAVWSGDFHHQIRRALAGDADGCFRDFDGSMDGIAAAIRKGWFYDGQFSRYYGNVRGTDPSGIPLSRFVFFLQNHDQVGNRALGNRLHHSIDAAAFRAATVLLLLLPETPLLFMGQEWAASTRFAYFTDHNPELGRLVRQGRREEFHRFAGYSDLTLSECLPDPQDVRTFAGSRLDWGERELESHASVLRLHKAMLALRRGIPGGSPLQIRAYDACTLVLKHGAAAVIRLKGAGNVDLSDVAGGKLGEMILSTEDPCYSGEDTAPILVEGTSLRFARPGAAVFAVRD